MTADAGFVALGDETYVSLTTFRRTGEGVATAVWVGRDGDDLLVTTRGSSGKVKRIRNSGRVELRACSRTGEVAEGAAAFTGVAEVEEGDEAAGVLQAIFRVKYGQAYENILAAGAERKASGNPSVVLRIRSVS